MTSILLLFFLITVSSTCMIMYRDDLIISTEEIVYVGYDDNLDQISLFGIFSTKEDEIRNIQSANQTTFTVYKITEIDQFGGVDVSVVYRSASERGFDGVFVSSSKTKIPGEITYLYYQDTTKYNLYKFEVRESFIDEVLELFPDGGYFEITKNETCDPYFNHWRWFYESWIFHAVWAVQVIIAGFLFVFCIYVLIKKRKELLPIFKLCTFLYTISSMIRVFYGVFFVIAKWYKQGEYVFFFEIMDIIGGLVSINFTISGILLYLSYWQIAINTILDDFSKLTRTPSMIISGISVCLSVISVVVFSIFGSSFLYFVCYAFYVLVLFGIVVFYIVTMMKIFSKLSSFLDDSIYTSMTKKSKNEKAEDLRKVGVLFSVQFGCIVLIVILACGVVYLITPIQSTVFVSLIHILMGVIIYMQVSRFLNIEEE